MNTSNISVEKEILSLESKTLLELREIWKSVFNSNPPPHAKKVLIPKLAYKLQEIAYGSLSEKSTRDLDDMANQMRKGKKVSRGNRPLAGTRIVKNYRGEEHEVIVDEKDFIYRGQRYQSISAIADKITGTNWNGWLFFNMKNRGTNVKAI